MNRINYTACVKDQGKKLGDVIIEKMDVSKRLLKRCKSHPQGILVNGVRRTVRYIVKAGDRISLIMSPSEKATDVIHEDLPLSIAYEDEMVMVVDKPPGMTMFPRRRGECGSLAGRVLAHLEKQHEDCMYHPVSRLDIGTSGLVLIAKNSHAASWLSRYRAKKYYQCYAFGNFKETRHLTEKISGVCEEIRREFGTIFWVNDNGKNCSTYVTPLFYDQNLHATGCWVYLETGRRHQIRVHLAHQGHPLIGDGAYGGPNMGFDRPLLHACALSYHHPRDGRLMHHFLGIHSYKEDIESIVHPFFQIDFSN